MTSFHEGAYPMAALSGLVALFRALMAKGVFTREEAVRVILDEAVARAIQAEAEDQDPAGRASSEINRQSAEILKFLADKL